MSNAQKPSTPAAPLPESAPVTTTKAIAPEAPKAAPAEAKKQAVVARKRPAPAIKKAVGSAAPSSATAKPAAPKLAASKAPARKSVPAKKAAASPVVKKVKQKLVRDSFTMPSEDFVLIDQLKARAINFKRPAKKSELLRAGLQALAALSDAKLKSVLDGLTPLKAGRPKKNDA